MSDYCCFCLNPVRVGQAYVVNPNVGQKLHSSCARDAARAADAGDEEREVKRLTIVILEGAGWKCIHDGRGWTIQDRKKRRIITAGYANKIDALREAEKRMP